MFDGSIRSVCDFDDTSIAGGFGLRGEHHLAGQLIFLEIIWTHFFIYDYHIRWWWLLGWKRVHI